MRRAPFFATIPLVLLPTLLPFTHHGLTGVEPNVDVAPDGAETSAIRYTAGNTAVFTVSNPIGRDRSLTLLYNSATAELVMAVMASYVGALWGFATGDGLGDR